MKSPFSYFSRTKHQPHPAPIPAGPNTNHPANSAAVPTPAAPAKNNGAASHVGLYGKKKNLSSPPTISHKYHQHISDANRSEILAIDKKIQDAFKQPDKESAVTNILTELLDKPFFDPSLKMPLEKMQHLFAELDECPIAPDNNDAEKYADTFIKALTKYQNEYQLDTSNNNPEEVKKKVIAYLQSNRSDKANFQTSFIRSNGNGRKQNSAQKMGLETFAKAFPLTISSDKKHVELLKKLIDILPNLEHHKIIDLNAQRRGLRTLEKSLASLPPNDVAEVLAHLMNHISDLSQKLSRLRGGGGNFSDNLEGLGLTAFLTTMGPLGLASILGATAAVAAPVAVGAGLAFGAGVIYTKSVRKQPQGTALHMLKDQLAKLRQDWNQVTDGNKDLLIKAFEDLQRNYDALIGTKKTTLRRFFNDSFIDPSKFRTNPNPVVEQRKRFHHKFIAPITSRAKSVIVNATNATNYSNTASYQTATTEQKRLADLLAGYHNEAKNAGIPNASFPSGFLENFIEKTKAKGFQNAAKDVHRCFSRIKEMEEYKSSVSKPQILSAVVEMTNRLATGDETFVHEFASTCQLADADCQNNARQIFKILTHAVIADKAMKGEDGMNNYGNLLALGRSFFHEETLKDVTRDLITHKGEKETKYPGIEVEIGNAVEIALGRQYGISASIQGMGYNKTVESIVTPKILKAVQEEVDKRLNEGIEVKKKSNGIETQEFIPAKTAFTNFLMDWAPLAKAITENPAFKKNAEKIIQTAREEFLAAEEAFDEIEEPTQEQTQAYMDAADNCKTAELKATNLLREVIENLVDDPLHGADEILGSAIVNPTASHDEIASVNSNMDRGKTLEQLLMEENSSSMEMTESRGWRGEFLNQLKEATPVTDAWFEKNNYEVVSNNGDENNCLILALLQHATGMNNDSKQLASLANKIREKFDQIDPEHRGGDMLEIYSAGENQRLQTLTTLVKQELASTGRKGDDDLQAKAEALNPIIVVPSQNGIPTIGGGVETDISTLGQGQMIIYGRNGGLHFEAVRKKEDSGSSGI